MKVYVNAKQIKKRGDQIAAYPYELKTVPQTLRQLLCAMVTDGVEGYNRRVQSKENLSVLSKDAIDAMSQVGKIGFGIPFDHREADLEDALETAVQGFADGLYRLFVGEREMEDLDEPLCLREGDTITIIRLVMLTGGYF